MKATIWSRDLCVYCDRAKSLLTAKGIEFEERKIGDGWTREQLMEAVPDARSVPQIFINDQLIGGYTALEKYLDQDAGGYGDGQL